MKYWETYLSQCHFFNHESHITELSSGWGGGAFSGERLSINGLSRGKDDNADKINPLTATSQSLISTGDFFIKQLVGKSAG